MAADSRESLLAHLAWKFTGQTETLATEALGYILSRSVAAREALRDTLRTGGADVAPLCGVATEVIGEQDERVDLVAVDEQGSGGCSSRLSSGPVLPTINPRRIWIAFQETEIPPFCSSWRRSSDW